MGAPSMNIESIDYCLLIGELEGVSQHLNKVGEINDLDVINEMKAKYYKKYFSTRKNELLEADR